MTEKPSPRVIIHLGEDLVQSVFFDAGVDVVYVCDAAPNDRFYRATHEAIPEHILNDMATATIGHANDGSPANARCHAIAAEIEGEARFSVVDGGKQ